MNQKSLILAMLRKGPVRTSHFVNEHGIGKNFVQRIHELRHDDGYEITCKRIRQGESEYRLVSERCECRGVEAPCIRKCHRGRIYYEEGQLDLPTY